MKKVKSITCWTDYPFVELGDVAGQKAPIRHVTVVKYDGDKYVTISVKDCPTVLSVKAGYLYSKPGRLGSVPKVNIRKLERMGDGKIARENDRWRSASARAERQFMETLRREIH